MQSIVHPDRQATANLRYADDDPDIKRFPRVQVIRPVTYLGGPYYAKVSALGRLVSTGPGDRCGVLFERASAHLVNPNDATQCLLEVSARAIEYAKPADQ